MDAPKLFPGYQRRFGATRDLKELRSQLRDQNKQTYHPLIIANVDAIQSFEPILSHDHSGAYSASSLAPTNPVSGGARTHSASFTLPDVWRSSTSLIGERANPRAGQTFCGLRSDPVIQNDIKQLPLRLAEI